MNILHIYKDYYPVLGGIENHIKVLAEAQVLRGHQVTVLVANQGRNTIIKDINGVSVIFAGRCMTIASTPVSIDLFRWVKRLKAEIAHIHFPHPPGEVANLIFRPTRKTVITYHSDIIRQHKWLLFYEPLLRKILRNADRIIATSQMYIETSPYLSQYKNKCIIVPLGVDIKHFQSVSSEIVKEIYQIYKIPQDKPLLVFVGRLRYYKGIDDLLFAMQKINNAHLLVIGDGPMRDRWQELSRQLDLNNRVTFTGEVDDNLIAGFYKIGDLFVLPANSRAEAFGTVILEAMAAGLPIISTEVGSGTSWVNINEVTGLVIPPRDPKALSGAINQLLAKPGRRHAMGKAAQERVCQHFSQEAMIDTVERIYYEVLSSENVEK